MPNLLIAGCGFLGESLTKQFSQIGWHIQGLTKSGAAETLPCDLSNPHSVTALRYEPDLIIHCASSKGGGAEAYRSVYLEGCKNLLVRYPDKKLIFVSSTSVYPQVDHQEVTEQTPAHPLIETAQVLREAENIVLDAGGAVLRLSGLCGANRMYFMKSFMNGSLKDKMNSEDTQRIMNFIHRDDAAKACLILDQHWHQASGEIWNASGTPLTRQEAYQLLLENYPHLESSLPAPLSHSLIGKRAITSKRVVSQKLRSLGWSPQYLDFLSLAENLIKM